MSSGAAINAMLCYYYALDCYKLEKSFVPRRDGVPGTTVSQLTL